MAEFFQNLLEIFHITRDNWWQQAIGLIGLFLSIICFQTTSHKRIMVIRSSEEILFGFQYILLGSYTAAGLNLVGPVRNILFERLIQKGKSTIIPQIAFSLFMIIYGAFTWQGWISLIVIFAKVLTTIAFGIKNTKTLRLLTFIADIMWIIHSIYVRSIGAILTDSISIIALLVAIIRFDVLRKENEESIPKEEQNA